MYRLGVTARFASAHFLRGYRGSCESMHGHNYRVEARVEAAALDIVGLGLDFRELKRLLGEVVAGLDHRLLNDLPAFAERNPSSELIARHIYEELAAKLPAGSNAKLVEVRVWETDDAWASWAP
jgi:6-pyruvoyltetrahydropterin/6-carboxytetrahydropterin synthase